MYLDLSTNTRISIYDYNQYISSLYITFSSAYTNINAIPGLCTLNSTVTNYDSTIRAFSQQFPSLFSNYSVQELSNSLALSTLSLFTQTYTDQYISTGVIAFSTSYSTFAGISAGVIANTEYVSSLVSPAGEIQNSLDSLYSLQANVLDVLVPFAGSTVYYAMLETIPNYSTSVDAIAPGDSEHDPYLLRSTFFSSVTTHLQESWLSTATVSNVGIQTYSPNEFSLDVLGYGTFIQSSLNGLPSVNMPNFNVYASEVLISSVSTMMLSARFSSIVFNEQDLVIQRIYANQRFGLVGINLEAPSYSLDIGVGDARKPSGTSWITVSDERVKCISVPDPTLLRVQISQVRLVRFTWTPEFSRAHEISSEPTLGFLSQEVQTVFPRSVFRSHEPENGYTDFLSLDTDQLVKAKFAVTQQLLYRVSSLQARINALVKES